MRPLRVQGDVVDDERLVGDAVPVLAAVVRAIEAGDGAGVDGLAVARIDFDVVDAAVVEAVAVARPEIAAVHGVVDPAARGHPDVVGVVAVDRDREHVGVEDHAAVDQLPALAAVVGADALAPRADVDAVVRAGVEGERLDVDLLGDLLPRPAGVRAAIDPGEAADENEVRVARIDGDGADGEVLEAGVAARPGAAAVGGDGDDAAAPQPPTGGPKAAVAVDDEVVDDVAGELDAVARVRPRPGGVVGDVDLAAAGADVERVGIGGIDDERADVGAEELRAMPLRGERRGHEE